MTQKSFTQIDYNKVSVNRNVYSPLFKPLIIYSSTEENSTYYTCVCFGFELKD